MIDGLWALGICAVLTTIFSLLGLDQPSGVILYFTVLACIKLDKLV
jgi:hypothetical protein